MERSIRVQGLVLHHYNYGEADRFVRLLTAERGKISALARGVRRMNSRKAGHLEPFTLASIQLARGLGGAWVIDQVSTIESFPQISGTLERTTQASYVTELTDRFALEEVENRPLFLLAVETIRRIASMEDPFPALRFFDLRLLDLTGFRPDLQNCVICRREIQAQNQFFSASLGGVVCPACYGHETACRPISVRTLKFLRYYQKNGFKDCLAAGWPIDIRSESEQLLTSFLTFVLERKINSQEFLENIRK